MVAKIQDIRDTYDYDALKCWITFEARPVTTHLCLARRKLWVVFLILNFLCEFVIRVADFTLNSTDNIVLEKLVNVLDD